MWQFGQGSRRRVFGVSGILVLSLIAALSWPGNRAGLKTPFTKYVSAQIAVDLVLEAAHSPFDSIGLRTQIFRLIPDSSAELADAHLAAARDEMAMDKLAEAQQEIEQSLALADLWLREQHASEQGAAQRLWLQRAYQTYLELLLRRHHRDPEGGFAEMAWRANDHLRWLLTTIEREGETVVPARTREIRVADVQRQLLDERSLLLEYALSDERSYVWVISKDRFDCFELPSRATIEETATPLRALLSTQPENVVTDPTAEYDQLTQALSGLVLQPFSALLAGQRLIIVPDGVLQFIPFSILPLPPTTVAGKPRLIAPVSLLSKHEIQNLPSATTGVLLQAQPETPKPSTAATGKTVALIADPVFGKHDERVTSAAQPTAAAKDAVPNNSSSSVFADVLTRLRRLEITKAFTGSAEVTAESAEVNAATAQLLGARLPAARREAETIAAVVPQSAKLLDFEASRAFALSGGLAQYPVLHFATHGFLHPQNPALSGLLLSQVNEQGQPVNGLLLNREISQLHLTAELVVLSACETGVNANPSGQGTQSVAQSFLQAGAHRVVASLWQVNDAATAELMRRFYQNLFGASHGVAAHALRNAQLELQRETPWKNPFYWAGFIVLGEA